MICQIYFNSRILIFQMVLLIIIAKTDSHKCASIFTERHFHGFRLNLTSDSRWRFRGHLNLIPGSVKILESNCALSMFDGRGNIQTIKETTSRISWPGNHPVHFSCCQCGQCERMKNQVDIGCARIYQYEKCNACIGTYMQIQNNEELNDFQKIHDRLSSAAVRNGCHLEAMYEVSQHNRKVMIKVDLKSGDNLLESQDSLFNKNATLRIRKAFCTCSKNEGSLRAVKVPHISVEEVENLQEVQNSEDDFSLSKEVYDRENSDQENSSSEDQWLLY